MNNVTAAELRAYLEEFHGTYRAAVRANVAPAMQHHLERYSRLPTGITGYVSTRFGVGYEYIAGDGVATVEVGSQSIEDLFCKAPSTVRKLPVMVVVSGHNSIGGLTLSDAFPFRFSPDANGPLRLHEIKFTARGWVRNVDYAELFPNRLASEWTVAKARERAQEEVLTAMSDIRVMEHENVAIGEFLAHQKQKTVIVAGDYSEDGRSRLNEISRALRQQGYMPVSMSDVPEVFEYDLPDKFAVLATMARFVVIDDSSMSGHIRELAYAAEKGLLTIVLRKDGGAGTYMTRGEALKSTVLREFNYSANASDPLFEATQWAEEQLKTLGEQRKEVYPWREDLGPSR